MMRSPRSALQGVRMVLLRGAAKLDGYNFAGPPFANPPLLLLRESYSRGRAALPYKLGESNSTRWWAFGGAYGAVGPGS